MKCIACSMEIDDKARFCGGCGAQQPDTELPKAAAHQHQQTMFQGSGTSDLADTPPPREPGSKTPLPKPITQENALPLPSVSEERDLTGATLNGRFRIDQLIGEGSFGTVYRGEQLQMGRTCAVKVLHASMARDAQIVSRFRREAKAIAKLKNGHVVQTYDFDATSDGMLYLAMEFVDGRSLETEMEQGPMPAPRVLHILNGIAEALAEAHSLGIVHRDIKPANILLEKRPGDDDYVKVLDFGIAKIVAGSSAESQILTAAGQTLGTVEFMSPEQLMGLELDGRSDLYALGIMAYEMLTGVFPYETDNTGAMITGHLQKIPLPPSQRAPELGIAPEIDDLVFKLLEKKPEDRLPSALELQAELRGLSMPLPVVEAIEDEGTRRRRSQNRTLLLAGLAMLLIALVAAILLWWSVSHAAETRSPAVRLIPKDIPAFVALDMAQVRSAGPPAAIQMILNATQPLFRRLGAKPSELGQVVVAVTPRAANGSAGSLLIMDLPIDLALLDRNLKMAPVSGMHRGVKIHRGKATSCGVLPGHRLVCGGDDYPVGRLIDMAKDRETSLVEDAAASLLGAVGAVADGEKWPTILAWCRVGEKERSQIESTLPAVAQLDQAALAMNIGADGADIKLVGRCLSDDGAGKLGDMVRTQVAEALKNPMVLTLGIKSLVAAVKIEVSGKDVVGTLHLTREQYVDIVTRASGMAATYLQAVPEPDTHQPAGKKAPKHRQHKAK